MVDTLNLAMEAAEYLPPHVKLWVTWMQVWLILLPFLFIRHRAAQAMIIAQILNFAVGLSVFVSEGHQITKLFGLGHIFWIWPMLLFFKEARSDQTTIFRIYAGIAALTIAISLFLDARDTIQWLAGDRGSVLVNVPSTSSLSGE